MDATPQPHIDSRSQALKVAGECMGWGLLAMVGRLMVCATFQEHPLFSVPLVDGRFYAAWAGRMAVEGWFAGAPFTMSPLYGWSLVVLDTLGLDSGWELHGVLALWGGVTVSALCAMAHLLGGAAARRAMGVLGLVFLPLVMADINLMKTGLGVMLFSLGLLACLLAVRWSAWRWLLAGGLLLGWSALVREPFAVTGVVVVAVTGGMALKKKVVAKIAAALMALAMPLVFNGLGQYRAGGSFHLLTAAGGEALYLGLGPEATGTFNLPAFATPDPAVQHQDFRREASKRTGRDLTARQADSHWRREALSHAMAHPGRTVKLLVKKLRLLVNPRELPSDLGWQAWRREVPVLRWLPVSWGLVLPFAAAALFLPGLSRRVVGLLVLAAALNVVLLLPFFVYDRFRLLALLPLLPLAAAALPALAARPRRWSPWAALVVMATVMVLDRGLVRVDPQPAYDAMILGDAALQAGQPGRSKAHYEQATEDPVYGADARLNLGVLAMNHGQLQAAAGHFRQVLGKVPGHPAATLNLALAHAQMGNNAEAARLFQQAVAAAPENPAVWSNFGAFLMNLKRYAAARAAFERALGNIPGTPPEDLLVKLVYTSFQSGDRQRVQRYLKRLDAVNPTAAARAREQVKEIIPSTGSP